MTTFDQHKALDELHRIAEMLHTVKHLPEAIALQRASRDRLDGFRQRGDGPGGSGGVSDPTGAIACDRRELDEGDDDWLMSVEDCMASMMQTTRELSAHVRRVLPDVDRRARPGPDVLCTAHLYAADGDEWAEPVDGEPKRCLRSAETAASGQPRRELLCSMHRTRRRRAIKQAAEAAAVVEVESSDG